MKRQLDDDDEEEEVELMKEKFSSKSSLLAEDKLEKVIPEQQTFTPEMEALDEELRAKCQCNPYSPFTHAGPFVLGQQLSDAQFIDLDQFVARRADSPKSLKDTEDPNHYYMLKIVTLPWCKEEESYSQRQAKLLIYNEYSVLSMLRDLDGVIHHHGLYMDYFFDDSDLGKPSIQQQNQSALSARPENNQETSQSTEQQPPPPTTTNQNNLPAPQSQPQPQQEKDHQEATQIRGMLVVGPTRIMNSHPASSSILASKIRNSPLGVNWGKQKQQEQSNSSALTDDQPIDGKEEEQSTTEDGCSSTHSKTATVNSNNLPVKCPRRGKLMRRIILALDCYIAHIYCSTVYPLPRLFSRFTTVNSEYENLQEYVKRYRIIPEMKTLLIMKRIVDIVHELHKRNIAHRDLRLENILFNHRDERVILINFGLARYVINDRICICDHRGSSAYISPDVLRRKPYNPKASDCWAMGIIFFTLLFGKFPFYAETFPELFKKINIGQYSLPPTVSVWMHAAEDQPTKTDTSPMVIYHKTNTLISRLIVTEANKRMTAGEFRKRLSTLIREKVLAKCRQEDKRLIASGKVRDDQLQVVPDVLHNRRRGGGGGRQFGLLNDEGGVYDEDDEDEASRHLHDHNYFQSMQLTKTAISNLIRQGQEGPIYPNQQQFNSGVPNQSPPFAPPLPPSHSHLSNNPGARSHPNAFCKYLRALCLPTNIFRRSFPAPSVYSPFTERFYLRFGGQQEGGCILASLSEAELQKLHTPGYESERMQLALWNGTYLPPGSRNNFCQPSLLLSETTRNNKRHKSFSNSGTSTSVGGSAGGEGAGTSSGDVAPYLRSPTFLRLGSKKMAQTSGGGAGVAGPSFSSAASAAAASSSRYSVIKVEGDVRPLSESEINLAKSFLSNSQ